MNREAKMILKRFALLLVAVLVLTINIQFAFAETVTNECAMFPFTVLNISRTNGTLDPRQPQSGTKGGHVKGRYAWDLVGSDRNVKAPFTGVIVYAKQKDNDEHLVILQSEKKVFFANGIYDYMSIGFVHDDDISDLHEGQRIKQGEIFYQQGTFGDGEIGTFQRHLHIECAQGKHRNLTGLRSNGLQVNDALFITRETIHDKDFIENSKAKDKKILLEWREIENFVSKPSDILVTTNNAEILADFSVKLSGVINNPSGLKITECGIILVMQGGSEKKAGVEFPNNNTSLINLSYDRISVKPGVNYVFYAYAISGNDTYIGKQISLTTTPESTAALSSVTLSVNELAINIETTTAKLEATCNYSGMRPSEVGVYYGTSRDSLSEKRSDSINFSKNPFNIWYNLNNLSGGTTYYYRFFAIADGKEISTNIYSFTTKSTPIPVTITNKGVSEINSTTVKLNATCSYVGTRPSSVGVYFGLSRDSLNEHRSDTVNFSKNPFKMWYNLTNLTEKTTYYYRFYAIVDGKEISTETFEFMTK